MSQQIQASHKTLVKRQNLSLQLNQYLVAHPLGVGPVQRFLLHQRVLQS